MARTPKSQTPKPARGAPRQVDALKHEAASRKNIPTAEMESFFRREEDDAPMAPRAYPRARALAPGERRTPGEPSRPELIWNGARITISQEQMQELAEKGSLTLSNAQLVWRGKDRQDWSDLVVNVPPIYVQEKIHPKAIIDDLKRRTAQSREAASEAPDLFADFNGVEPDQRAEFYQHDQHWSNRMILGDSLQVMASLGERESLRGKVQCIYFDPPYGIKFNSNWQVSTQSRDVKDGKQTDISREPEQVKAFRDTWADGVHSYLTYLRDRLTVMRDLLTESGSIFVQIGDENVHRVRAVMDEVFGAENFCSVIQFSKTSSLGAQFLDSTFDHIIWYFKDIARGKFRRIFVEKELGKEGASQYYNQMTAPGITTPTTGNNRPIGKIFAHGDMRSQTSSETTDFPVNYFGLKLSGPGKGGWKTNKTGMDRLFRATRLMRIGNSVRYVRFFDDYPVFSLNSAWMDTGISGFSDKKSYVVQTAPNVIQRCILMATDPGDLVLDPTCGSGTTAYVAEQWGRRWITIDTSRVALTLARTRLMAARYPWFLLADSPEGRAREAALAQRPAPQTPTRGDLRQGFVYQRVPHVTLKSIANNPAIDDIWARWQETLEPLRADLNKAMGATWEEWEIPRALTEHAGEAARKAHEKWWEARIARQSEIDASIAARADVEYLYDKPYEDKTRVRVAGPFTVESLSPHRAPPASDEELIDEIDAGERARPADPAGQDFAAIVLDYLRSEGVKQQDKGDRIVFESLSPWPGAFIGAQGVFREANGKERRAAILIGPEYGTVGRGDIVAAAREAADARFDVLIACAFNFDAHSSELARLGALTILKARINPDMHMSQELKNTGRGNMFVVFGEPDVEVLHEGADLRVKVNGVDVFDPNTGDIRSADVDKIAAWFIDTEYDEESFFVRHAYFLGANDPYKSLKTALQADIDKEAWDTLYSDVSRPFPRPKTGRIAVKVINHFGDEVMKVLGV